MLCTECDNDSFEEDDDGFFYCQHCHVKSNDIIAIGVDESLYKRTDTRNRPPQDDFEPKDLSYEAYYKETRDRYVKGFLSMVTYQCDAFVERFNVTPLIVGLVGPICLRFVALSGVFDNDWADKAIRNSEGSKKSIFFIGEIGAKLMSKVECFVCFVETEGEVREAKLRNRHKGEPRSFDGKRAVTIWISQLRKSLPLSSSLAISFLACHKAGSPVLPTDIVRWAQEGKVPYLSTFLEIQTQMGVRSKACPVEASVMFRPVEIVSARSLEARAASIADVIGLPLPPVNFYGIALNYLKRLSMAEDKVLDVVRLIQNWSMPSELYLSKNELRLPTRVCVMSIVIVAIRMLYNINGFGVREQSLDVVSRREAYVVSEELDSPVYEKKATEFDTEELLKNLEAKCDANSGTVEHEKDLLSYLSHGKNELFTGLEQASADDTYITVDKLWNGYMQDKELKQSETPLKRGRDWENDQPLNQLSLDETKFRNGNNPCTSGNMSMEHDRNQEEEAKERAISRLITEMRGDSFCYIPPRVKVKKQEYLHYTRRKEDGGLIYAAHADYYILLRACAGVAEIDVRNMHRGVLSFERRLGLIEKKLEQVLHIKPQVMNL
ncbi:unnamed protein product [Cochlearia groenlandica]